jgi:hypothetical protein
MPKIDIHNLDELTLDELTTPRSGTVGLLEGRKAMGSLYASPKWDNPKARNSKPKKRMVTRASNTRKLGQEAYEARLALEVLS